MVSKLESLSVLSVISADTGDVSFLKRFHPTDCTTNPSLILKAAALPGSEELVRKAVKFGRSCGGSVECALRVMADRLQILFGAELAKAVPGKVSTEVDPGYSFDVDGTVNSAMSIIAAYEEFGIERERILIKIAATWEGILAAKILERRGVNTNLTLVFNFVQAQACAEAGVFLISPFVGRICDWFEKNTGIPFDTYEDPGVRFVRSVYMHYESCGLATEIMAASLRSVSQIEALAGCDRLTIPPSLLQQLAIEEGELNGVLVSEAGSVLTSDKPVDEAMFRWMLNEDAMATEKLAEGIRLFAKASRELIELLRSKSCD